MLKSSSSPQYGGITSKPLLYSHSPPLPKNALLFHLLSLLLVSFSAITKSQHIHQVIIIIFKRELLPSPGWGCSVQGCLGWDWLCG